MKNNNITRRDVMGCTAKVAGAFLALPYLSARNSFANAATSSTLVNDIHSQLNPTRVNEVLKPQSAEQLAHIVVSASQQGHTLSLAGKRHAMGGQQFGTDTDLIDMTSLTKLFHWISIAELSNWKAGPFGRLSSIIAGMSKKTILSLGVFLKNKPARMR